MKIETSDTKVWEAALKEVPRLIETNHRGQWKEENYNLEKVKELAGKRKMSGHLPFEKIS